MMDKEIGRYHFRLEGHRWLFQEMKVENQALIHRDRELQSVKWSLVAKELGVTKKCKEIKVADV